MSLLSLMPTKSHVVVRGAEKIKVVKNHTVSPSSWIKTGNLYVATIYNENVNDDSLVFVRVPKEFLEHTKTFDIMYNSPGVTTRKIRIYATEIPTSDIIFDYVIINDEVGVLSDKATDVTYRDTANIGATTLQSVIDKIIAIVKPQQLTVSMLASGWIENDNNFYIDISISSNYTLPSDVKISLHKDATKEMSLQFAKAGIFYISRESDAKCRIYGYGTIPTMSIPINILL